VQGEIELRQMRYFLAVAEERHFTRAARRCHIAQPSLSRRIRALENSLGTRVFDRLPREIRLTAAGKVFQKEAAKALEHSRRAVSQVRALERQKGQQLKIGLSALCDQPRIQALVQAAQKASSEAEVECIQGMTPSLLLGVLRGTLDLAIIDLPVKERGISIRPIQAEPLIAVLPQSHPLSVRPMVRVFELKQDRVVLLRSNVDPAAASIETALQQAGISTPHPVSSIIEQLDHVAIHRSVGLLRASAGRLRRDGVLFKPLGNSIQLETGIAWRTDDRNPAMVSFRDALIAFSQRQLTA
jgi:DNA-binding transcriptional LysR family regulator